MAIQIMSTITKGTAKPKKKATNARKFKVVTIALTSDELDSLKEAQEFHKSLSVHDIAGSLTSGFFECLTGSILRTLSFWEKRDRKDKKPFNLRISNKRYRLYECVAKLLNRKVDYVIENSLVEGIECTKSYIDELATKPDDKWALDVIQDISKDVILHLTEEKRDHFTKDHRNLTVWERIELEHVQPA